MLQTLIDTVGCVRIWTQGDGRYLAANDPVRPGEQPESVTTWDSHDTPEEAVEALARMHADAIRAANPIA